VREALRRGFRVTTNTTLFDGADPKRSRLLRRNDGPRRRRHDAFARILLRQSARPETFPRPRPHPPPVPRHSVESQEELGFNQSPLFLEF
jgi:hypothetical protein